MVPAMAMRHRRWATVRRGVGGWNVGNHWHQTAAPAARRRQPLESPLWEPLYFFRRVLLIRAPKFKRPAVLRGISNLVHFAGLSNHREPCSRPLVSGAKQVKLAGNLSLSAWRLGSWVDVDLTGTVALVTGYPTTNRVWYRAAATPLAADVQRMTADVAASFREQESGKIFAQTRGLLFVWSPLCSSSASASQL